MHTLYNRASQTELIRNKQIKAIVLVVDDEQFVRECMCDLLKSSFGDRVIIHEAQDGAIALEMAKQHRPDIILTDIYMPKMDGLEFCATVKDLLPGCRLVLISGHTEFEFARKALQIGIIDYQTKPISPQSLITLFIKLLSEFEKETMRRLQSEEDYLQSDLMKDLLSGKIATESVIARKYNEFNIPFGLNTHGVLIIAIDPYTFFDNPNLIKKLYKELHFSVRNILRQYYMDNALAILFDGHITVMFCDDTSIELAKNRLSIALDIIFESAATSDIVLQAGASIGSDTQIQRFFFNAQDALVSCYQQRLQFAFRDIDEPRWNTIYKNFENKLESAFLLLDSDKFCQCYNILYDEFPNGDLLFASKAVIESLEHILLGENISLFDIPQATKIISKFCNAAARNDFEINLDSLFLCIIKHVNNRSNTPNRVTIQIMDYIQNNYQEKITLAMLSNLFQKTPNYLCSLFKSNTGQSFVDYLNQVRIQKAKELLKNGSYLTYEIADMVGYNDYRYFSQMFKKITDLTPSEFRQINSMP